MAAALDGAGGPHRADTASPVAFFQSSFITTLATAGTSLLSLSFVFAVTTQEFLGSCIFLFVKHPYDVGDRVDITGPEKEQLLVEKISLLYTVFVRIDKMQVVQVRGATERAVSPRVAHECPGSEYCFEQPLDRERDPKQGHEGDHRCQRVV